MEEAQMDNWHKQKVKVSTLKLLCEHWSFGLYKAPNHYIINNGKERKIITATNFQDLRQKLEDEVCFNGEKENP